MPIYLDYAAATPIDERVLQAMWPYFREDFFNPSASYAAARRVRTAVEAARAQVGRVLAARSAEIVFTAGGTEANNLAIHGVMERLPGSRLVVSAVEHESVLAQARVYPHAEAPVHSDGSVDLAALEGLIDDKTVLVSVMYANNEVGTIQPIRDIAALVGRVRDLRRRSGNKLPLYLHTDATQAANYLDLHVSRLGVDLMTLNGGKIYGPKQTGVLYVRTGIPLAPLLAGGGQEGNLRSGTENVSGIVGFSTALAVTQEMRGTESQRLVELQRHFFALLEEKLPGVIINGSRKRRLPNNVHVTLPGHDNERVIMALDEMGIMAAAGSACAASDEEPSHVLAAMGIQEADAQASLRFTMGRGTRKSDVRLAVDALAALVA
jgi:cysteine desulfurase